MVNNGHIIVDVAGNPAAAGLGFIHSTLISSGDIHVIHGGLWLGYTGGGANVSGAVTADDGTTVNLFGPSTFTATSQLHADRVTFFNSGPTAIAGEYQALSSTTRWAAIRSLPARCSGSER